ncbi:glycoside hydrolase family 28 protein [Macrolepiota fuliginosa MF-IS2]|uniref:galacturonan 1,4-alpha-galacturonidase n=1 Tax=Macrolepiota fuliginosa MF-IS2 TaxID=1400762 RepID=A0A9P5XI10_9AGAR|nr:glycoside hydrolase family 28 protein [Macrolepiota fuliginosa MF-IS2]
MAMAFSKLIALVLGVFFVAVPQCTTAKGRTCTLYPLGPGMDDTDQVEAAIAACGHNGTTIFEEGSYNITRKMMWDLDTARVDLKGVLSFQPDIQHWLNSSNTFQVVFIQSQSSWFVVTGKDFIIDAHNTGGIDGNGQPWWNFFTTVPRRDGNGRPISFTLWRVTRGVIRHFTILSPPFWANTVAESTDVVYNGMLVNATNTDPAFAGQNIVWNTDGIDTYRSDKITMLNWDVTCGDDCIAIKGNSSNIIARNFVCRGGEGIAFGSVGQYANMTDFVSNVLVENVKVLRLSPEQQPNMEHGIYFKTWDGAVNGMPPTGGGGGPGLVKGAVFRNVQIDSVETAVQIVQNFGGGGAVPSKVKLEDMRFENIYGTTNTSTIVKLECGTTLGCSNLSFVNFDVNGPDGNDTIVCDNTWDVVGLGASCN